MSGDKDKRNEPPTHERSSSLSGSHSTMRDDDRGSQCIGDCADDRRKTDAQASPSTPQPPVLLGGQALRQFCTAEAIPAVELDQHEECDRRLSTSCSSGRRRGDAGQFESAKSEDDDEEKSERTVVDKGEVWDDYPDGGKAWLIVLGAGFFCCTQMAYGLTWGVFLAELKAGPHKDVELSVLTLVAGLSNFMMAVTSFAAGRCGEVFGYKRVLAVNVVSTYAVQIISAFVYKSLIGLFLAQGALLGIVMGLGLPLYLSLPSQWFKKKRGVATGLCAGGSGFGAGIWQRPTFYSFELSIFVAVFGFLTPAYYLTAYTTLKCPELDPKTILPALPLVVMNLAGCFGRVGSGFLADKFGPVNAMLTTFFLGGFLQCVMWPFTHSYGSILAFAILQGATGNWFMSLIPVAAAQLFGVQGLATIVGFTVLVNSPGQLAGASVSGVVLSKSGGNYQAVAWYAGGVMIAGAIILLYARFAHEKRILARY
ncbi:hypothetical protein OIV83_001373 [Microbotryomycetes sp. JL201]|nr:hypothetical protein OIV83_001373 [Microbotryomycetes sp. JL201]